MDVTYVFIRYISVTIQRQARAFYSRCNKIIYHENKEFIESVEIERSLSENYSFSSSSFYNSVDEKITYQDQLIRGLMSLDDVEKFIIYEKFLNQRSDVDIGSFFSISGQMVSKKKRKILSKLKELYFFK